MADKQLFAKIGVFVLLGLNVGAYYIFWPTPHGAPKTEANAPRETKGESQLLPAQTDKPTKPAAPPQLPAKTANDAVPLSIPSPPKAADTDDAVSKLLEHIRKEAAGAQSVNPGPMPNNLNEKKDVFPAFPGFPEETKPKSLPLLKADPLGGSPNVGITSALTPKTAPGAWLFQTETLGNQTLLIAKLRQPANAPEFRITCDRVQMASPDGDVQAIGKITFAGAGFKGTCQRLTLTAREPRLLFEEQVSMVQEAGGVLRGERITWESPLEVIPTGVRPGLGAPK